MQQRLFAAGAIASDNAVAHLRKKLVVRFGVKRVLDGFVYFPVELRCLGLGNPLIPLFLSHTKSLADPMDVIDEAFELAEQYYAKDSKASLDGSL